MINTIDYSIKNFNKNQKLLQKLLLNNDINKIKKTILIQNSLTHSSKVTNIDCLTLEDKIWEYNKSNQFTIFSNEKLYSVAWHLWHSARIEDICSHFFISKTEQVLLKNDYINKLNINFICTGNSFDYNEMKKFNNKINLNELKLYRIDVGAETSKIINKINIDLLKSKVKIDDLYTIEKNGFVDKKSKWLLDFWGRKKISGIISMPLTRHLMVHLNESKRILKIK